MQHTPRSRRAPARVRQAPFPWTPLDLTGSPAGSLRIVITDLSQRGVAELLTDSVAMRCWGALRRSHRGTDARSIAAAARTTAARAQSSLDTLVSLGLAARLGGARDRRASTYRSSGAELVVAWRPQDAAHRATVSRIEEERALDLRDAIEALGGRGIERNARDATHVLGATAHMTARERSELSRLVLDIERLVLTAQQRDERRSPLDAPPNVIVSTALAPVAPTTPTVPCVFLVPEAGVRAVSERLAAGPMDQLSGREREVAAALALGLSRKAIAAQAGLAEGTIVTLSRRVYRKLGVHNRAELATRLGARVVDGTPRG